MRRPSSRRRGESGAQTFVSTTPTNATPLYLRTGAEQGQTLDDQLESQQRDAEFYSQSQSQLPSLFQTQLQSQVETQLLSRYGPSEETSQPEDTTPESVDPTEDERREPGDADGERDEDTETSDEASEGDGAVTSMALGAEGEGATGIVTGGGTARRPGGADSGSDEDQESEAKIETVPDPLLGSYLLLTEALSLPSGDAPFNGPRTLDIRPDSKADPQADKKPQQKIPDYKSAFAAAADAAARLHAELVSEASRLADEARSAEHRRADQRQSTLDSALLHLRQGLTTARTDLAIAAEGAEALLMSRANAAKAEIRRAARRAAGALAAQNLRITTALVAPRALATRIEADAVGGLSHLEREGERATDALRTLSAEAPLVFPPVFAAMKSAQNEAIAERVRPRAMLRAEFFNNETQAQVAFLEPTINSVQPQLREAFRDFDEMIAKVARTGPAAVERARKSAFKQVDRTVRQLKVAITAGRARTDAALVHQHNAARAQLIDASEGRAAAERLAAENRAKRDVSTASGLARGQGAAVRAVATGLERERKRPDGEFAQVVMSAAKGLGNRVAAMADEQRPRLSRSAAEGLETLDDQSAATGARLLESTEDMAARLKNAADQSGAALSRQVGDTTESFHQLAPSVSSAIQGYMPPIGRAFDVKLTALNHALAATQGRIVAAFAGASGSGGGEALAGESGSGGETAPPAESSDNPAPSVRPPNDFISLATRVAGDAKTENRIATLIVQASTNVADDIHKRRNNVHHAITGFTLDFNEVLTGLRGLTARQGRALKVDWKTVGYDLVAQLKFRFENTWSAGSTIDYNFNAAVNYLNGRNAQAALQEMQAAVNYWDDEARVEQVQRSLTPQQLRELHRLPGSEEALDDIASNLDGVDLQVFEALRFGNVGMANAARLQEAIDTARKEQGDAGADQVVDRIVAASQHAGDDPIAGADPLGLDESEVSEERNRQRWLQTQRAFAILAPLPSGAASGATMGAGEPGAALYHYATAARDYVVPDDSGIGDHSFKIVHEGVGANQARLIENIIRFGEGTPEASAARLAVEMNRSGGPNLTRLDTAMHDPSLDPVQGQPPSPQEQQQRMVDALARREEIFRLYDQYTRGPGDTAREPAQVQEAVLATVSSQFAGDEHARHYAESMIASPAQDSVAAFNYAVEGAGTHVDVLRRTFSRMTRKEVDLAVASYNRAHPEGPSLYARLGIHGQGNWLMSELSGDEKNEIELASMGVPQDDRERAEVAHMAANQQIRDSGVLGRLLAHEEYSRLVESAKNLRDTIGVQKSDFDSLGRLHRTDPLTGRDIVLGNFTADGRFQPPPGTNAAPFEIAMGLARLSAETYQKTTDRIANYVTTALVVTAAILSTALTGGAAASIWLPILVTAGAGLVGIGASALIKGGRYGHEEIARDLATTIIQAATAGLGAAAGVALRGGMPALRAVAGSLKVSETALAAAAPAAMRASLAGGAALTDDALMLAIGQGAKLPALRLTQELGVGALTGGFGGGANALLDSEAWHRGDYGMTFLHGLMRGAGGGFVGAGFSRLGTAGTSFMAGLGRRGAGLPALRPDQQEHFLITILGRATGSGLSGAATRGTEILYDRKIRHERGTTEALINEMLLEGAKSFAQGLGEGFAEHGADTYREQRGGRTGRGPRRPPDDGPPPPPPPVGRRPTRPPDGPPHDATPTRPDDGSLSLPPAHRPPDEGPPPHAPRSAATLEGTTVQRGRGTGDVDEHPTPRMRPSDDDEVTQRIVRPGDEPVPIVHPDGMIEFDILPESTVMMDPDPTSHEAASENYGTLIRDDPNREVGLYHNPVTGEYIVIQGTGGRDARVAIAGEAPQDAGYLQAWKEILDADVGRWQLLAHYHPGYGDPHVAGIPRRLPSGEAGDFSAVEWGSRAAGGAAQESRIHYLHDGEWGHTDFGYNPASTAGRYWLDFENPQTGLRERHEFATLGDYERWIAHATGQPPTPHEGTPGGVRQPGASPDESPPSTTPRAPLFIDIQGGPAVHGPAGEPTFLPSLVAGTPDARGLIIEPGDYIPGYAGITTANARDLEFLRILAHNLPQWPAGPGEGPMPLPADLDPTLAFPTQGPVQVMTQPGAAGTTPVPVAFFPPVGGQQAGGTRLIPVKAGDRTAQADVTGLTPTSHPELHGQVDRAYWRRPFALGSADAPTLAAMGQELGRILRPGGFLELRLLRGAEEAQARAIAAHIPGADIEIVPRGAIEAFMRDAARPAGLNDRQWEMLQDAAPDLRGEFGALGRGTFNRLVRIYRGADVESPGGVGGPRTPMVERPPVLRPIGDREPPSTPGQRPEESTGRPVPPRQPGQDEPPPPARDDRPPTVDRSPVVRPTGDKEPPPAPGPQPGEEIPRWLPLRRLGEEAPQTPLRLPGTEEAPVIRPPADDEIARLLEGFQRILAMAAEQPHAGAIARHLQEIAGLIGMLHSRRGDVDADRLQELLLFDDFPVGGRTPGETEDEMATRFAELGRTLRDLLTLVAAKKKPPVEEPVVEKAPPVEEAAPTKKSGEAEVPASTKEEISKGAKRAKEAGYPDPEPGYHWAEQNGKLVYRRNPLRGEGPKLPERTFDPNGEPPGFKNVEKPTPVEGEPSNIVKGDVAEDAGHAYMEGRNFELIGTSKQPGPGSSHPGKPQGLDGVYLNKGTPPPKWVFGEGKWGKSGYGKTVEGIRQGTKEWAEARLDQAVGKKLADQIRSEKYEMWELRYDPVTGKITPKKLW
jgi:hypothetical protein